MTTVIIHRKVRIVLLDEGETIAACCRPGDVAILADAAGWWLHFIDQQGQVDGYDQPYPSDRQALWAAKAAAEFGLG